MNLFFIRIDLGPAKAAQLCRKEDPARSQVFEGCFIIDLAAATWLRRAESPGLDG